MLSQKNQNIILELTMRLTQIGLAFCTMCINPKKMLHKEGVEEAIMWHGNSVMQIGGGE
jgi:hypothetical protein